MCGGLTNRIFAVRRYAERANGLIVSSAKDDVTSEAIRAVAEHRLGCEDADCRCQWSTARWLDMANADAY
jgi:hypothetical protein